MSEPAFTGERFIPGQGGFQMAYEHLHRYLFAGRWARDAVVMDIATGSGYGAELLARVARLVYAMDLDGSAVLKARYAVRAANVRFLRGDATSLPVKAGSIELVVAMEVLEHVADPERMVREMARIVCPGGVVLVSTPDRATYSDARHYANPFHVREFYQAEFLRLLFTHFPQVCLLKQQVRAGSQIELCDSDAAGPCEVFLKPPPDPARSRSEPLYLLALCAMEPERLRPPEISLYLDETDAYLDEWVRRLAEANAEITRVNAVAEGLGDWGRRQDEEILKRDTEIRRLAEEVERLGQVVRVMHREQEELKEQVAIRDKALSDLRAEFDERGRWALSLEGDVADRDVRIREAVALLDRRDTELKQVEAHLSRIRHEFLYRVLCRLRLLPK